MSMSSYRSPDSSGKRVSPRAFSIAGVSGIVPPEWFRPVPGEVLATTWAKMGYFAVARCGLGSVRGGPVCPDSGPPAATGAGAVGGHQVVDKAGPGAAPGWAQPAR